MQIEWSAVAASILPNIGGIVGGIITRKNIPTWYKGLNKPNWRPPNWMFPPVWTYLYTSMGYASYLVWRDGGGFEGDAKLPLMLYASQLTLNWIWTPIFFGSHNLKLAFFEIMLLVGNVGACIVAFKPINETASYLLLPYMAWVSFAAALNFNVWRNNPKKKD